MKNLLDYNLNELQQLIISLDEPKYRAGQLYNILLNGKKESDKMNIPNTLVQKLSQEYYFQPLEIEYQYTAKDKTTKYVFKLHDGNMIEGVLMRYKYGNTLCISTQVGCKMNCAFCASGLNGFVRNLTNGEILGQYVSVNTLIGGNIKDRKIDKIVLMGTGEPLDNFDNVTKFLQQITDKNGYNLGVRNISISTCGLPDKIEKLADMGLNITLSLSLHASNDKIRQQIMPIAKRYTIARLFEALDYYEKITSRRIIIEYTLIKDINSSKECAKELAQLLKGKGYHVNLIRLNEVPERGLKSTNEKEANEFLSILIHSGISATIRRTTGDDVSGACGQLRNKIAENKGEI